MSCARDGLTALVVRVAIGAVPIGSYDSVGTAAGGSALQPARAAAGLSESVGGMDDMAGVAAGPRFGQRFAVDGQIGANGPSAMGSVSDRVV